MFISKMLTRRIVLVGLAFVILFVVGCGGGSVPKDHPADAETRIMSFNIRYGTANDGDNIWPKRKQLVFDVIADYKPDVLGLQEALRFQIDEILDAVDGYKLIGVGREAGANEGEYSCILYRTDRFEVTESETFWLSDTPNVVGSITWGNACTRICTWARFVDKQTGGGFYFYNTHLDHRSQPSKEKSAALIAQRIADRKIPEPYILTGDFNTSEDNPVVQYLTGDETPAKMVDTFRVLDPDEKDVGTFNGFKGVTTGAKIDYILAEPGMKVLKAEIVKTNKNGSYPSDHFPVTATLAVK